MSTINQYHKVIRKISAAFAGLFNNIIIIRQNADGTENQRFKVPIVYANKEKYVKRLEGDPDLNKKIQIVLPVISYEMTYFRYDPSRKLNTMGRNFSNNADSNTDSFMMFNPVPYDIGFSLTIYTRNIEDGHQIIEYILPFFTPEWNLRLNLIPEMNIIKTIPIELNEVIPMIDSEGPVFDSPVRIVMWTLNFTAKAFIFGAIKDAKLIKEVQQNFLLDSSADITAETLAGCCGKSTKTYQLLPGGHGEFQRAEIVYQGLNLENSYATGIVRDYDANNCLITVADICGAFKSNQTLIGNDTLSIHVIEKTYPNTVIAFTHTTKVEPWSANATSNWTANVSIVEFPDTL
jgi:hypothetical protein